MAKVNRERLDYIAKDKSIDVVIAASWWAEGLRSGQDAARYTTAGANSSTISAVQSREFLKLGLEEMVLRMRQAGKTVYLVQDNAEFVFDPARLMKTRVVGPRRALARLIASTDVRLTGDFAPEPHSQADEDGRSVVADVVARNPDVQVIDLKSALCGSSGCQFAEGDRTLYMDEDHLTSLGARIALAEWRLP